MTDDGDLPEVGRRLVEAATDQGIAVRLVGGVAICLRASHEARAALGRAYPDLDLVARERQSRQLRTFLEEQGYEGEKRFNAAHGAQRLLFWQPHDGYQIDIFLDVFNMSHKFHLGKRLETEPLTLPAAELLLTKLQIVELNAKDVGDVAMLLWSHELADEDAPGKLNIKYVAELCARDWGLHTTVTDNFAKAQGLLKEVMHDGPGAAIVAERLGVAVHRLQEQPKSMGWKARASVGRRKRWYETPEEVNR